VRPKKAEIRYKKRRLPSRSLDPFDVKSTQTTAIIKIVKAIISMIKMM
jgi:hypothetical protein